MADFQTRSCKSLHSIALDALRTRRLIRLPYDGGNASSIRTERAPEPACQPSDAVQEVVDSLWATKGEDCFDGALMGVTDASVTADEIVLACRPIRYRDYLAADAVLEAHPASPFPIAVGVHAILSCPKGIVCLRLDNGRIALPGGAVDAQDLMDAPGEAIVHAAIREVAEETGIDLRRSAVRLTGLYVGGYPTHTLAMLYAGLCDADTELTIRAFRPGDALDKVEAIELRSLDHLIETMTDLPLVMRAALRSLRHWKGQEPAWTIAM